LNERLAAMPATLQEIRLTDTDILPQLRLPHHPDFREKFRTRHFAGVEERHGYIGMGAGHARGVRSQSPGS
jgi:hypothetical protein